LERAAAHTTPSVHSRPGNLDYPLPRTESPAQHEKRCCWEFRYISLLFQGLFDGNDGKPALIAQPMSRRMPPPRLYVWPPLSPAVYIKKHQNQLPFPLGLPNTRMFSRARHGLFHGIKALGLGPGDRVLVPGYNNGSEVEAIERAGPRCVFYDIQGDLQPDKGHLESLIGPDVKALYLIHYFGFPQDALKWRAWCDERGLLLIEDAAMAWLGRVEGRPVGSAGDFAIFCLYKSVGLPDGGCVTSAVPLPFPTSGQDLGLQMVAIRHASWLAQRIGPVAALHSSLSRFSPKLSRLSFFPGHEFDLGDPNSPPCRATLRLISRVADQSVAERRRAHYRQLLGALAGVVQPIFPEVPDGASPVGFPIWASPHQQELLDTTLTRVGVFGTRFWPNLHPSVPADGIEGAHFVRTNSFVLPIHQELRRADLDRIVRGVVATARNGALTPSPKPRLSGMGS
jgi:DegT/DnrJ/EryC1/StrS aminotransferase family